ncbi:Alpha/Beta hydrolase protein [Aspergillus lucknowensis]|uniref:Alpha/Beta hydrolase protein n=1 Tax=Aspergillus lucknowensis TaxID=176173 RepID=A0ABR4LTI4_9EURO
MKFSAAVSGLLWTALATAAPRVDDDNGVSYVGTVTKDTESFLNIRYGQDTGNENRFKRPQPYSYAPDTVVDATAPGAACPQKLGNPIPQFTGLFGNTTRISEDCLTLRVDRPVDTPANAQMPVLVHLHGGGYAFGSAYDDTAYPPAGLVRENDFKDLPAIYVAINYRLGAFGFAASDALREEDNLNVGLLDQRLGLQWVQDHIEAFGGNKHNVTIFGSNVGFSNVQFQLTAYGRSDDAGLFSGAILSSGPTLAGDAVTAGLSDQHTASLAESLDCASEDSAAELACLRSTPLDTIVDAAVNVSLEVMPLGGMGAFRPTAPSSFIPDAPSRLLRDGRFNYNVNIIAGWNEDEGTQWVPATLNSTAGFVATLHALFPGLSPVNLGQLPILYPLSEFHDFPSENIERNYFRAARAVRDAQFVCPAVRVGEAWERYASDQHALFIYSLNQTVFRVGDAHVGRSHVGVDHFSDIPYLFDYIDNAEFSQVADQSDYDIASHLTGSWSAFARFGQPSVPGLSDDQLVRWNLTFPDWVPARQEDFAGWRIRVLGGPRDGRATILWGDEGEGVYDESIAERCRFWGRPDVLLEMGN